MSIPITAEARILEQISEELRMGGYDCPPDVLKVAFNQYRVLTLKAAQSSPDAHEVGRQRDYAEAKRRAAQYMAQRGAHGGLS